MLLINSLVLSNSVVFCVANQTILYAILLFSGQVSYLCYPYPYYNLKIGTEFFINLIQQVSFPNNHFSLWLFAFILLSGMQCRIYFYGKGWPPFVCFWFPQIIHILQKKISFTNVITECFLHNNEIFSQYVIVSNYYDFSISFWWLACFCFMKKFNFKLLIAFKRILLRSTSQNYVIRMIQ